MKSFVIDDNNVICTSNTLEQGKKYVQIVEGYKVYTYDKSVLVFHKNILKEISFKEIGSNMGIFWIKNRKKIVFDKINYQGSHLALSFYNSFDEEIGDLYHFFPKISEKDIISINSQISNFTDCKLIKTSKGICLNKNMFDYKEELSLIESIEQTISFLFVMTILYGNFVIQKGILKAFKIHIPLFGKYLVRQDLFDTMIDLLRSVGFFIKISIQESGQGVVYQISSSDYEILLNFKNFFNKKAIDNVGSYQDIERIKQKIILFFDLNQTDKEYSMIQDSVIKLLIK